MTKEQNNSISATAKSNDNFALSTQQQEVVELRGRHLQVIACAGSGKTESISRRVAGLINEGEPPASIIAFTFTERAASELKERILLRVEEANGTEFLGHLAPMFIGTIHGYCFRLLQRYVPRYGNYDVLDEHRHVGLLSREFDELGLGKLGHRHWKTIGEFVHTADVIGNELIDPSALGNTPLGDCYRAYAEMLDRYRLLTYSGIISKAVEALADKQIFCHVHGPLRHLLVDEYQDINPAQEKLIQMLSMPPVELCVVGDDDQSIYQWRGSDVRNILTFSSRRKAAKVKLETNRRSRPQIVRTANAFAKSIPERLPKVMKPTRVGTKTEVVTWIAEKAEEEALRIAETIERLHHQGYRYQDIAVLFRSVRTSAMPLVEELEQRGVPYVCGGRTGLFLQPEISLFGEIFAWFVDGEWKDERFGQKRKADLGHIVTGLSRFFNDGSIVRGLRKFLEDWKAYRLRGNRPVNLVGDFYRLLNFLKADQINVDTERDAARFGAFARFSQLLADFEHVTRRGNPDNQTGRSGYRPGRDRGKPFYQKLYSYLMYYARDAYEDFEGEQVSLSDAVNIITVHQAKGLEWPVVFIPSLTDRRFPSFFSGRAQDWLLPEGIFPKSLRRRYEGGDTEERRLFYVALTRAKDATYLSCFSRITKAANPSPYLKEVAKINGGLRSFARLPLPDPPEKLQEPEPPSLNVSFSELASYEQCAFRYRLASSFGFQQQLAIELGYGKAIHHVLRHIAEYVRDTSRLPTPRQIEKLLDKEFYLPFANRPGFTRMYASAKRLIERYMEKYRDDLTRVWEIERPFQVYLPDGTISGRADIILDMEGGHPGRLAIVDYKTAKDIEQEDHYQFQIAVYAAAARGEGLDVVAGYVHGLQEGTREGVDISVEAHRRAVSRAAQAIHKIRKGAFGPQPAKGKCYGCDYHLVCGHACERPTLEEGD
jgi:DNA helicase-2/ATP-dependent DNA helicase PcrA